MTLKIERILSPDDSIVLRVSGRIDGTYVPTLQESIQKEKATKRRLVIDLTDVTLVSPEAVAALADAEADGVELRDCPAYVREWVSRSREHQCSKSES